MHDRYRAHLRDTLERIRADGFEKKERVIGSPQAAEIELQGGARVLNFCANNYLGLANDPRLVAAARDGLSRYGFGMASVRFICGTQSVHTTLETTLPFTHSSLAVKKKSAVTTHEHIVRFPLLVPDLLPLVMTVTTETI